MAAKPFWMHEDDFARTEVLPLGCWEHCRRQLAEIETFAEAHRAPDGIGWTRMYMRPDNPRQLEELAIGVDEFASAMPWRLRRVGFSSGTWSGPAEVSERAAAYRARHSALVFGWNANRLLVDLWFIGGGLSRWQRGAFSSALERVGRLRPLLLVDWRGALVDLSDRDAIDSYLTQA